MQRLRCGTKKESLVFDLPRCCSDGSKGRCNMRIKSLILLVLILCVAVSACGSHSGADRDIDIKLDVNDAVYDVEKYFSGASAVDAYNYYKFMLDGRSLELYLYDEGQYFSSYEKKQSFNEYADGENVFYYRIIEIKYDVPAGTKTSDLPWGMEVVLSAEGYDIVLRGDVPRTQKDPAEMISLLKAILAGNDVEGLELIRHDIRARLTDGLLWINIETLSDGSRFAYERAENLHETDGIKYYIENVGQDQNSADYRRLHCRTDRGFLNMSVGAGHEDSEKVTSDDYSFIDFSLAEKLAKHLGITIVSFE